MRTTIALDNGLMAKAQDLPRLTERSAIINEALKGLMQRESARRLALLGGTEPHLKEAPRRRLDAK